MAKFLNTSATNYFLEELIKASRERLIIISPFLKFNDRMRELLEDKDRMKLDIRIVYGKSELSPPEINWLQTLKFVRTSFCQHLHAKCYMNERTAIITSMNLYEFSQINNNEMGVLIDREVESELYKDTYEEAQRLIRVSEEVRLSAQKVEHQEESEDTVTDSKGYEKLTTSKLGKQLSFKTAELMERLAQAGYLTHSGDDAQLTEKAKGIGAESRYSRQFGSYFLWPRDLKL